MRFNFWLLTILLNCIYVSNALAQCSSNEVILFDGMSGKKEISICASPAKKSFSKIEYRYGPPGSPEMIYVVDDKSENKLFASTEACDQRSSTNNIWFKKGNITYIVSECNGANCTYDGGVLVLKNKKIIATITSKASDKKFGFTSEGPDYSKNKSNKIITKTDLIQELNIESISACDLYESSSVTTQSSAPIQTKSNDLEIIKKDSSIGFEKSEAKQIASTKANKIDLPTLDSTFNLKGFHLNMTREDVKKLIPNSKREIIDTIGGKELSGYYCGVTVQQAPSVCNFTYAGEVITAITVAFWGERAYEIQLYFGAHRKSDMTSASVFLDRRMQAALDTKYPRESNSTGPNGNPGTVWEANSERIIFEYVEDKGFYSNSLSLVNTKYRAEFSKENEKYQEKKQGEQIKKSTQKLLSDM